MLLVETEKHPELVPSVPIYLEKSTVCRVCYIKVLLLFYFLSIMRYGLSIVLMVMGNNLGIAAGADGSRWRANSGL